MYYLFLLRSDITYSSPRDGTLDMGTNFDCMDPLSWTTANVSAEAKKNRQMLKTAMEKYGFAGYEREWWHFKLKDEPFREGFGWDIV